MTVVLCAEEDPHRAGHARVMVQGLTALPEDRSFTLRREGFDRTYLGTDGWQVSECRLQPVEATIELGAAMLLVGPSVTRHTEAGPLFFGMPGAGFETYVHWPDVDVFAGDYQPPPPPTILPLVTPPSPPLDTPPPTPPITPPSVTPSTPPFVTPPPSSPKPRWPLWLLLFTLLLAASGGGWWFLRNKHVAESGQVASAIPTPTPTPTPTRAPTPSPTWPEGTDGLTLQQVVERAPDSVGILIVAQRRQAAGRYDDALVLFEEAADRGQAPALTALARLYDPNGFVAGRPFRTPDPRAAARYYRDAVRAGDTEAETPRAALRQALEAQARDNNPTAASALQEFWP